MGRNYQVDLRGNVQLSKEINKLTVLNLIRKSKVPISRADIARSTGLTTPTISNLVAELIQENLVMEIGLGDTMVGRRPVLLKFNAQARAIAVGLVEHSGVTLGVTDLGGEILEKRITDIDLKGNTRPELVLEEVGEELKDLIETWESKGIQIWGTGVALTGGVDGKTGVCIESHALNWINVPVRKILEPWTGFPLYVDNNIRCMVLGEKWFGVAQDERNVIGIRFGKRVGSGIVIGSELFEGARGVAGEIGHLTVELNGPKCYCGNRGCLEVYVTETGIEDRLKSLAEEGNQEAQALSKKLKGIKSGSKLRFIASAAKGGDKLGEYLMEDLIQYLSLVIANLAKSFNPSTIVLLNEDKLFCEEIVREIRPRVESLLRILPSLRVDVVPSHLGEDGLLIGASALVLDNIFRPIIT